MPLELTRRNLLRLAALAPAFRPVLGQAQGGAGKRSTVSLVKGDKRRQNVADALAAIDPEIRPVLRTKKSVVIKVNNVSTTNQLAASHADSIHGILDYIQPRFQGPVYVVESSAGDTLQGFDNYAYAKAVAEHKNVSLIDLNREGKYKLVGMIDYDLHEKNARMAARLYDPDAYIISAAMLKTHNVAIATLSIKNMALGAPLHGVDGERWNDKRVVHNGLRQTLFNMFLAAQSMRPYWGAAVIDGYEGMEGNGPSSGTPVASRLAIASTDYVAADRVAAETMGIDAKWMALQQYCEQAELGVWDLAKIDVRGEKIADVQKKYRLHADIERELEWQGPLTDIPKKIG